MRNEAELFEAFKEKARLVHGDKFSYDKFDYVNANTVGTIVCNTCGYEFNMTPNNHVHKKQGCPRCSNRLRKTTSEFIEQARKVHGEKYDYSKTDYWNTSTKVEIICKEHGSFMQTPSKHLMGQGCPICSKSAKVDFDEFVRRARQVHGDAYEYHRDKYETYSKHTVITCKKHGDFSQVPQAHVLLGQGCKECWNERRFGLGTIAFQVFTERARKVHGDKYEYDEKSYTNYTTPCKIICKKHGEFTQVPQVHVDRKRGCQACLKEELGEKYRLTLEEFIRRSVQVHGNKYDYSEAEYKGNCTPLKIICKTHGEFYQQPIKHWSGQGCPRCNSSHLEEEVALMLEKLKLEYKYQATKKDLAFLDGKSLDFYIPSRNIAIECQGIQHFKPFEFFGGYDGFESLTRRDEDKYMACTENGVRLVYYTNLENEIKECEAYKNKTAFTDITQLEEFLRRNNSNETANQEEGIQEA